MPRTGFRTFHNQENDFKEKNSWNKETAETDSWEKSWSRISWTSFFSVIRNDYLLAEIAIIFGILSCANIIYLWIQHLFNPAERNPDLIAPIFYIILCLSASSGYMVKNILSRNKKD